MNWPPILGKRRQFIVTILGERGEYPDMRIRHRDALYVATPSLVYTAVPVDDTNEFDDISEVGWAGVGSIRWWGALAFAQNESRGFYCLYPLGGIDVLSELLNEDLIHKAAVRTASRLPTQNYQFRGVGDAVEVARMHEALMKADNILLRGASCWLKMMMLWSYMEFREEMAINLHIALEAALGTLRKRLSVAAGRSVSYRDVYAHVAETFENGEGLVEFMQERRDDRNMLLHPDSESGAFVVMPMMADDIYELIGPTHSLYRYILVGEKPTGRGSEWVGR